jgi:hypothetical protein
MAKYLFIESRDPFESADWQGQIDLIRGVRERGHETLLFLVQNGVLAARQGARYGDKLTALAQVGVQVLGDRFSLRERAIEQIQPGVQAAEIGALVGLLLEPETKAIWH